MEEVYKILREYSKRTIGLSALEVIIGNYFHSYEDFANFILNLEDGHILQMVKAKGRTTRNPSLAFEYRIDKSLLQESHHRELQKYRTIFHHAINLDEYYKKDSTLFKHDLPYIKKIDDYLKTNGFPIEMVPAPERSFEIVQDEKWITEKKGKDLLERIGLFDRLKITPVSDPLMFAVNPKEIQSKRQYHFIVENKTTYQGLLPALKHTTFSTLIYGSGKKIVHSIEQFSSQYPVEAEHFFFYFGDLDREGVSIWYSLFKKVKVILAIPFYEACLKKGPVEGKDYQKQFKQAQEAFIAQLPKEWRGKMSDVFSQGKYYPQEILKSKELQQIWRESDWETLIYKN